LFIFRLDYTIDIRYIRIYKSLTIVYKSYNIKTSKKINEIGDD